MSCGSGAIGGAAGTLASYPFDLLRTTLAAQGEPKVYNSMGDAMRGIVRERGIRGMYSGVGITLLEIMPYVALQFGLFDALNGLWDRARRSAHGVSQLQHNVAASSHGTSSSRQGGRSSGGSRLATAQSRDGLCAGGGGSMASLLDNKQLQHFTCGLLAGLCAKLVTHPLDVAKKRYQVRERA